ncbi:MAG: hypothetical protein JKY54_15905, partial [Flavobacteriales bacterium]|nr:hypothetical protein [Flavobacteriales bacterium]
TQLGQYYKVQLDPFEILLQKDWLSFDLYKLQWVNKDQLIGIHSIKAALIDANDPSEIELLSSGNYKAECEFELQYPVFVSHSENDLVAQTIDNNKEFFRTPLDMEAGQKPLFSLHTDKTTLAIARPKGVVDIMNINSNKLNLSIETSFEFIHHILILPNGNELIVHGGPDNPSTRFYSMKDGGEILKKFDLSFKYLSGETMQIDSIGSYAVSNNGKYIAAGCGYINNPQLLVFNYETCELVKTIEIDFVQKGFKMFFSESGDLLFLRTDTGFMIVLNLSQ